MPVREIRGNIAESYKKFFYNNDGHIQRKALAVSWGLKLFIAETAILAVGLVLIALGTSAADVANKCL
jgi:hypothetical protein